MVLEGNAICYSGYRDGQNPNEKTYPSLAEIRAFGDAPAPALVTSASGSYTTVWGTWHVTQAGTTIRSGPSMKACCS